MMAPRRDSAGEPLVPLSYCDEHMGGLEMRVREVELNQAKGQGVLKLLIIAGSVAAGLLPALVELWLHSRGH